MQSVRKLYSTGTIDPRHKLAAAIRWFAGGSYLDIRLVHAMSMEQMYACVWAAVDAINSSDELQLHFPWDDEVGLQNLERGFSEMSGGKLRGCVFAVDVFIGARVRVFPPVLFKHLFYIMPIHVIQVVVIRHEHRPTLLFMVMQPADK